MGDREGTLGRTEDRRPSECKTTISASTRRQNLLNLPSSKASETMFDLTKGGASVDSVTRSREQRSSGRHGTAKTSAEGPSELMSTHPGFQPSIDRSRNGEVVGSYPDGDTGR
eukprot:7970276-Pyramimonas_sp.AAC.1